MRQYGFTPLALAIKNQNSKLIYKFLEIEGIDINTKTNVRHDTPPTHPPPPPLRAACTPPPPSPTRPSRSGRGARSRSRAPGPARSEASRR